MVFETCPLQPPTMISLQVLMYIPATSITLQPRGPLGFRGAVWRLSSHWGKNEVRCCKTKWTKWYGFYVVCRGNLLKTCTVIRLWLNTFSKTLLKKNGSEIYSMDKTPTLRDCCLMFTFDTLGIWTHFDDTCFNWVETCTHLDTRRGTTGIFDSGVFERFDVRFFFIFWQFWWCCLDTPNQLLICY